MVNSLGFPLENISVEKGLDQMLHLNISEQEVPERRSDIICFAKDIHSEHSLYPLLLVECKAVKLNDKVKGQVIGYHRYLQSYFIAIVNQSEAQTGWFNSSTGEYQFTEGLPTYQQLLDSIHVYRNEL